MKGTNFLAMLAVVIGLCVSSVAAQNVPSNIPVSEKYVISASAGGVNYLEGTVNVIRANGTSGVLLRRDRVEIGDRVSTGAEGRAEILLNPGSYIRLGKNSSFEFGSTDLEDLQLTLDSGSAMFEVFAANEFRVSVFTPKGKLSLIETGVYRVDVSSDGSALLSVTKGKAEVGDGKTTLVKDGRTGTVGNATVAIAKFDKDKRDDLAEWSRTRSKELTKITSSLQSKALNNTLLNGFRSGRWGLYDSFGLWIFNASFGGYCFVPFGSGWRSPYGQWYQSGIYWNGPIQTYLPPNNTRVRSRKGLTPTDTVEGAGNSRSSRSDLPTGIKDSTRDTTRQTFEPPPFTRVSRGSDGGFGNNPLKNSGSDFGSDKSNGGGFSPPIYSAPSAPPPPPVVVTSPSRSNKDNR